MRKGIIFDFDGVIVDSLEIKSEVFQYFYKDYGQKVQDKVKKHHLDNGGVSRYEKFKYYHSNFLNIELSSDEVEDLATRFSKLVTEKVVNCNYIPGAMEYIKKKSKHYKLFVSTGTPNNEINIILNERNISNFFSNIYGSPENKILHVKKIMSLFSYKSEDLIFFGDSMSDYEAAKYHKIDFILVENDHNYNLFKNKKVKKIKSFLELI